MLRPWWQDERFWRDLAPFLFPARSFAGASAEVDEILEHLELDDGARILDAGCGPGRIAIPLVQRGYRVQGFDICAEYRRWGRIRARQSDVELDIRALDGFALESGQPIFGEAEASFDAVLDNFALLGYHADPVMDILLVKAFGAALVPGGRLMIQSRKPDHSYGTIKHRGDRGGFCIEERRYDPDTRVMTTSWTVSLGSTNRAYRSQVRVYPAEDIRGLLQFCEFEDIEVYDFAAEERIVALATRPG